VQASSFPSTEAPHYTSVDWESDVFPVVFTVLVYENRENWYWFVEQQK
jgi:hypothetical protein